MSPAALSLRGPSRACRSRTAGLLAILVLGACGEPGGPSTATAPEPGPVGRIEYEKLLASHSGSRVSLARLAALAAQAEEDIESELDRAAALVRPSDDWRPVFDEVRRDHPPTSNEVLAAYREEVERSAAFLTGREWMTLPPFLPSVVEAQSGIVRRSFPLALYLNGALAIVTSSSEEPEPEYLANHCRVCIPPLAVHEAYPGHHVAFYHAAAERTGVELGEPVEIRGRPENFFFHEGWGLYAELLMLTAGYYDDPARELAAWRMLLLRATRARLDALLHGEQISPAEAVRRYRQELLMDPAAATTEVRRHLDRPTNKATYFVGLLQIQALRRRATAARPELEMRAFHDRLLRRPRPVPSIAREEFGVELADLEPLDIGG